MHVQVQEHPTTQTLLGKVPQEGILPREGRYPRYIYIYVPMLYRARVSTAIPRMLVLTKCILSGKGLSPTVNNPQSALYQLFQPLLGAKKSYIWSLGDLMGPPLGGVYEGFGHRIPPGGITYPFMYMDITQYYTYISVYATQGCIIGVRGMYPRITPSTAPWGPLVDTPDYLVYLCAQSGLSVYALNQLFMHIISCLQYNQLLEGTPVPQDTLPGYPRYPRIPTQNTHSRLHRLNTYHKHVHVMYVYTIISCLSADKGPQGTIYRYLGYHI